MSSADPAAPVDADRLADRALAAFTGLALGDALGMPTQSMSRERIARELGPLTGLVASGPTQPIAPSMPAGSVTDDTEQAVLVAELLVSGDGHLDAPTFARALADWERAMAAKGSLDLLGPSTRAAIAAIERGVSPEDSGRTGTTNGAAMRITPVGIATPPDGDLLLHRVVEASRVTHNTGIGLSGAAAVAMAISCGLEGRDLAECEAAAVDAASRAARLGHWVAGGLVSSRIAWACAAVDQLDEHAALDVTAQVIGTSVATQESVVAAFALAHRFDADPFAALCHAAAIGGDTDTIAAIAGAMLGARHGMSVWPIEQVQLVESTSHLDLQPLVTRLLELRRRTT